MTEIRLCKFCELNDLQKFINDNWKEKHILSLSKELLCWQHSNASLNNLNFVIGFDTEKSEITGILGFIPLDQFDPSLKKFKDLWLAVWKVKKDTDGLGIELLNYIRNAYNPNTIGAIGINSKVKKLYQILKFKTGRLAHYYFLNPQINDFKIAKANPAKIKSDLLPSRYRISRLEDISRLNGVNHIFNPRKSNEFIKNRYLNHPIYRYQLYTILLEDTIVCVFVTRKILINNSACIRIVDIFGEVCNIDNIESELAEILSSENAEYIDCLNYGIPREHFLSMGFSVVTENIIIPNYFEPFEQKNINIEFAYSCNSDNYIIFKGDSDQDRPNDIKLTP